MSEITTKKRGATTPLPSRKELLRWLIDTPGEITEGTMLDDARKRFHEILKISNSLATVEWLFNQLIGPPPRTAIVIGDKEVAAAAARAAARYLRPEEFEAWWVDFKAELGGNPFDWIEPTT
jgi:hypothetical protein